MTSGLSMTRNCGLTRPRSGGGQHQDIGNHDIALHIDKTAARFGLQAGDQCNGLAGLRIGSPAALHQCFDIAAGQQLHGLGAHAQRQRQQGGAFRSRGIERIVELGA
jgi:hypothetical protein